MHLRLSFLVLGLAALLTACPDRPRTPVSVPDGPGVLHGHWTGSLNWAPPPALSLALNPDGGTLAVGHTCGGLLLWDLSGGGPPRNLRSVERVCSLSVSALAWSPDGGTLAAAVSGGATIELWSPGAGNGPRVLTGQPGGARFLVWSPDGRRLAAGWGQGAVAVYEVATLNQQWALAVDGTSIQAAAFGPDGESLSAATAAGGLSVFSLVSGRATRTLEAVGRDVAAVALAPDGSTLAVARSGGALEVRDLVGGQSRQFDGLPGAELLAFSPDGTRLALVTREPDLRVRVSEVATGRLISAWSIPRPAPSIYGASYGYSPRALAFSADGTKLAVSMPDGAVGLWSLEGDGLLRTLTQAESLPLRLELEARYVNDSTYSFVGAFRLSEGPALRIEGVAHSGGYVRFEPGIKPQLTPPAPPTAQASVTDDGRVVWTLNIGLPYPGTPIPANGVGGNARDERTGRNYRLEIERAR